jgi:hypothetical protein
MSILDKARLQALKYMNACQAYNEVYYSTQSLKLATEAYYEVILS